MDPERARKLFEQAVVFSVQTSSGIAELYRLTPDQESFVKQSTKRSDTLMLAKKYLKAADAVEELEKALSAFPGLDTVLAPVPIHRQPQPYQVRGPGNGQIVPYIPVAPARSNVLPVAKNGVHQYVGVNQLINSVVANSLLLCRHWRRYKS